MAKLLVLKAAMNGDNTKLDRFNDSRGYTNGQYLISIRKLISFNCMIEEGKRLTKI